MNRLTQTLGHFLARYLNAHRHIHNTSAAPSGEDLLACLQPGDVLLIEGNTRISTAIKYLTQSTWSHAALYVGTHLAEQGGNPAHCFIEADTVAGVRSVGIEQYRGLHARICRPQGLKAEECRKVTDAVIASMGHQYDLRNIFDLLRYLLPTPPVPARFRRKMLALGSGDPTRAICTTLIAQAFREIHYPILSLPHNQCDGTDFCAGCEQEIVRVQMHNLYTPRDFDVSPYFSIIKPTLAIGFDFHASLAVQGTEPVSVDVQA